MSDTHVHALLARSLAACIADQSLPASCRDAAILVEAPRQAEHGDWATNCALTLAKPAKLPPRKIAELLVAHLPTDPIIQSTSIAGPGFINFTLNPAWFVAQLATIHTAGVAFGTSREFAGKKCQVEFVSANPTGPLHVGHGRNAVLGDVLANLMRAVGYDVSKEYYVNDVGVQIQNLGRSVLLRLRELGGEKITLPENGYQGDYIVDIAKLATHHAEWAQVTAQDEAAQIEWCGRLAGDVILQGIRSDLADCGIVHDHYFFESTLHANDAIEKTFARLTAAGHLFEQDGALWFRASAFGDEKDRVVRKADGNLTYFAADIAYHAQKFALGFDRVIDILGADHAGYVARMKGSVAALGGNPDALDYILTQLVALIRDGAMVSMSTRSGEFETLADLVRAVGRDVVRYFYLMRSHHTHLDFDLALATSQTMDNPVYYIQYAHARIASIFAKAAAAGTPYDANFSPTAAQISLPEELALIRELLEYPRLLLTSARELTPHRLTFYTLELARKFQSYYTHGNTDPRYRVLGQPPAVLQAKLSLLRAVQIVLHNALTLLGIHAPDRMDKVAVELVETT